MKYSIEDIARFIMALSFGLILICLTLFENTAPFGADLIARLGGALIVFLIGFFVRKDGANNDR